MTSSHSNLLLAGISLLLLSLVHSFPGGVGGCAGGRAAVEGPHLNYPSRQTGPIGSARLQMVLDDQYVFRGDTMMDFTIGQDHTLTLRKLDAAGKSFRGFLFRLGPGPVSSIDTTDALDRTTGNTNASVVFEQCVTEQGVGGLGHTNSRLKENVTGILRMDVEASGMPLDVTVVIQNQAGVSEFYYQQFIMNAVPGATGPGAAIVPTGPTRPPLPPAFSLPPEMSSEPPAVAPITSMPAPTTTAAPVQAPTTTAAPVQAPTMTAAPVQAPTIVATPPPVKNEQKVAPADKCGSLASEGNRGGAAAQAKDCTRRVGGGGRKRKLKGSNN